MALTKMTIPQGQTLTKEQYAQVMKAVEMPIVYDEDSPETTEELYQLYEPIAARQRAEREHPVMAFSVTKETMEKARSLGAGYTRVLSRLMEMALNDPDMIKKCSM